jgi:dolichyl-phosphate beta-glucosyltransferase
MDSAMPSTSTLTNPVARLDLDKAVEVAQLASVLDLPCRERDRLGHDIPDLTIVIPMFRESARIAKSVALLAASPLNRNGVRFLFVDDGSRDSTPTATFAAIEHYGLNDSTVLCLPENVGKGGALRAGFKAARGRYLAFLDADLSLDPAEVSRAFARMQLSDVDILVGERMVDEREQPKLRRVASRIFRTLAASIVDTGVVDPQCAMKIFRTSVAKDMFASLQTDGYAFDVEILGRAQQAGLRVEELPVAWHHQEGSKVDPLRDGLRMLGELLRIRSALRLT